MGDIEKVKDEALQIIGISKREMPSLYPHVKGIDIANAFLNKLTINSMFVAQRIHTRTGISFNSMLFFDDENRNIQSVSKMGVTSILVGNGVNLGAFREGLTRFSQNWNASQKNKQKWVTNDTLN
ncbi:hypothetical protein Lal_00041341 [Lupinus albus]|nr:hypothetical protein Lal_00041341 [Lupinus albus]